MQFQIAFLGLITFYNVTPNSGTILLPDGIGYPGGIPNHYGRLYVRANDVDPGSTWRPIDDLPLDNERVNVYAVDDSRTITIDAITRSTGETIDSTDHPSKMPALKELDPSFKIDPQYAMTQLHFSRGKLLACELAGSAVSVLQVDNTKPVNITGQGPKQKLVIVPNAEIVLANMSNFLDIEKNDDPSHFNIYRRLHPDNTRNLPDPKLKDLLDIKTGPAHSNHPVVKHIHGKSTRNPRAGCSGTVYSG